MHQSMGNATKQAKFASIRARILQARDKRDTLARTLELKYGGYSLRPSYMVWQWAKGHEKKKLEQLRAAYDRHAARLFALLASAPRNWEVGVPYHWVAEDLTFEDAFRPVTEQLSVVPPKACGY